MLQIRRYTENDRAEWERLVDHSSNGTFLHKRGYIEYHGKRFRDFSLVAVEGKELVAVFPAEVEGLSVRSHSGLSHGAWVFRIGLGTESIRTIIFGGFDFFQAAGIETVYIRSIPGFLCLEHIEFVQSAYRQVPGLSTQRVFQVIHPPFSWRDKGRKWGLNKALKAGLQVEDGRELLTEFWTNILIPSLEERHGAKPVHSLEEMQTLISGFPGQIKLFCATLEGEILAGVLVFLFGEVVHTQYIANGPVGRKLMALDLLMHHLLMQASVGARLVSLGTSIDPKTGAINSGLSDWKRSFGARDFVVFDFEVDLTARINLGAR